VKATTSPRPIVPLGSSRPAVRGLRASIPASINRLSAMAALRAATMATVIQASVGQGGMRSSARTAPAYANGSA
jgi:hypothetical protein